MQNRWIWRILMHIVLDKILFCVCWSFSEVSQVGLIWYALFLTLRNRFHITVKLPLVGPWMWYDRLRTMNLPFRFKFFVSSIRLLNRRILQLDCLFQLKIQFLRVSQFEFLIQLWILRKLKNKKKWILQKEVFLLILKTHWASTEDGEKVWSRFETQTDSVYSQLQMFSWIHPRSSMIFSLRSSDRHWKIA